jgi:integrase
VVEGERKWLSREQVQKLLAIAESENAAVRAFTWILVGSGARIGEVLGLSWGQIDLKAGTIEIRQALKQVGKDLFVEKPKSKAGVRTVQLPTGAVDALRALQRGTAPLPRTLVFCSATGTPWRQSNVLRRIWHDLLERAGIPKCGFHAARRGHISELLANGADLKSVSARVGHADSSLTVNTYQQLRHDADQKLARLTGELFAGKGASA